MPRHAVFILNDGAFVVQWDETLVQDLLTGRYRRYSYQLFGHYITDYELNQLKSAGRVEHFNRHYVWLYALPERTRFSQLKPFERAQNRLRAYYLSTSLPADQCERAAQTLHSLGLAEQCCAKAHGERVIIVGTDGLPVSELRTIERLQKQLRTRASNMFHDAVVAFVDVQDADSVSHPELEHAADPTDLTTLVASQTDTTTTEGKHVVLVCRGDEEQRFLTELCEELHMQAHGTQSAVEALAILEDERPDLLIMQMELRDMHGWELLAKLKESGILSQTSVIALAEYSTSSNQQSFAFMVAEIEAFLVKPISRARLRQTIWMVLAARASVI